MNNKAEWCGRRCKALGNRLEEIEFEISKTKHWEKSQGISYGREIDRWQQLLDDTRACLTDASAESSAAASEAETIRQEIIAE